MKTIVDFNCSDHDTVFYTIINPGYIPRVGESFHIFCQERTRSGKGIPQAEFDRAFIQHLGTYCDIYEECVEAVNKGEDIGYHAMMFNIENIWNELERDKEGNLVMHIIVFCKDIEL